MKKLLISTLAIMVMLISFVAALEIGDEFYLFGRDNAELCTALSMSEKDVESYCKQNKITVLAVNKDNTKQIRKVVSENEFSKKIKNLAVLSNDQIKNLTAELCGMEKVSGKVLEKNTFKYLKIEVKSKDSGGEYILTQYITVKDGKCEVLSFYTSADLSTAYCDGIFNSQFKDTSALKVLITVALALLFALAAALSVMIVRDLNKPKGDNENNA